MLGKRPPRVRPFPFVPATMSFVSTSSHPAALPVLFGLLAAATWGAADFSGGLATRRAAPSRVVLIAHGVSLLLLIGVFFVFPARLPAWAVGGGLLSGVAGGLALMVFYEALSLGVMGLSAALAGVLTALLPVLLSLRTTGAPAPPQMAGFAVAAVAIVLIAYAPPAPGAATSRRALLFATLAGLGFGLQLVWLHTAAAAAGAPVRREKSGAALAPVLGALLLSRLGGAATAFCAQTLAHMRHRERLLPPATETANWAVRVPLPAIAALAGLLDTAGNGFYMLSSLDGRLDVAAVLSSLYPGGTILLASLFLRERATRLQAIGIALALGAVALIAA